MTDDRRDFLKRTGAGLVGLAGLGLAGGCARRTPPVATAPPATPSTPPETPAAAPDQGAKAGGVPVAHVTHSGVWAVPGQLSQDIVLRMIDEGVKLATGKDSPDAGWKALFASDDVVAIKVNQISPNLFTHPVVALAIAQRLMDIGLRPGSIIIWDRAKGELIRNGYELSEDPSRVIIRGVDGEWEDRPTSQGSFSGRLAKILTQQCSALINVPVLKNHGGTGITLALKNHYGSFDNPSRHHRNQCDPYIADLNAIPAIKDKTRLIACDATLGCFNGGPEADNPNDRWPPNAILVATDPVAHDAYGTTVIEQKRFEMGLGPLAPRHVATAAARGLGTNDMGRISVLESRLA